MSAAAAPRRGPITALVMLAAIIQVLDTTIANVALPYMQGSLSASQDQIAWVLTSYIVASAITTPTTGWLSARFGRKAIFLASVAGFTFASLLCGAAQSLGEMVLFRVLQGIFGAALVPLSQAVMLDTYPREKHGAAMAIWSTGIMAAPILGPAIGGWLTYNYNWRWVFDINLPLGIIAFLGILAFVPETKTDRRHGFDLMGFAFLSLGVGALQMCLDRGELKDWFGSTEILIEAAAAALGLWLFIAHSLTAERPFLSRGLVRDRNFVGGNVFMFVTCAIMYASLALLPPMLTLLEDPIVTTGYLQIPRGITMMIGVTVAGRLVSRFDIRLLLALGLFTTGGALWLMTGFTPAMDNTPIIVTGLIQGLGFGLLYAPINAAAFATLPAELRAEGTGVYSLIRNIGGSIGISVCETLFDRNLQVNHAVIAQSVTPFNAALHQAAAQHYWPLDSLTGLASLDQLVNLQAAMISFVDDYKFMMFVCLAATPLLLLLQPIRRQEEKPMPVASE